jgi:TetR/AcrR family transcriptional regulator, repressor for uid operon
MRRANTQLKLDRRAEILDAAQRCVARSGFHRASMQEICAEAQMSPGNLYRYFSSKEAIIAGISERNRAEAAKDFAAVTQAPNFFDGLAQLARHHLVERTAEEVALCAEIMAESRRNPEIAGQYQQIETEVKAGLVAMLRHAAERGEIAADIDLDAAAIALMVLADGISWQRAVNPGFDAETVLPMILNMVHCLLTKPQACVEKKEKPQ